MNHLMGMTIVKDSMERVGRNRGEAEITNIQMIQMDLRNTADVISGRAEEKDRVRADVSSSDHSESGDRRGKIKIWEEEQETQSQTRLNFLGGEKSVTKFLLLRWDLLLLIFLKASGSGTWIKYYDIA